MNEREPVELSYDPDDADEFRDLATGLDYLAEYGDLHEDDAEVAADAANALRYVARLFDGLEAAGEAEGSDELHAELGTRRPACEGRRRGATE